MTRKAGILLHPTSLGSPYGVGDMGTAAFAFLEFLARAGQSLWQILPLGPTGPEASPYNGWSAMGGNPLLISPRELQERGLLEAGELEMLREVREAPLPEVTRAKDHVLRLARARLSSRQAVREAFESYRQDQREWLEDLTLFLALKEAHHGRAWWDWEPSLVRRQPEALAGAKTRWADRLEHHAFLQFLFDRQWRRLRDAAAERGIQLLGDVPIFVARDSVDVWAHPELFLLDEQLRPTHVAGVPPDYFSATGQLWGNPLYRWDVMARDGYAWWKRRLGYLFERVDAVRLDHFRGFQAHWEVPAGAPDARNGRWVEGPGATFLHEIRRAFGGLPIVAEDLGVITDEVRALKERFELPGMLILQFAFDSGPRNPYLPHNHPRRAVVYTGTHDNDTTLGWYDSLSPEGRTAVERYLGPSAEPIQRRMIRAAYASVAETAVLPMQDVLGLGSEARMNVPGTAGGNWSWRMAPGALTDERADDLRRLVETYGR